MSEQEKSEPASQHKLRKAREKGTVAKSQDVTYLAVLVAMLAVMLGISQELTHSFARLFRAMLDKVMTSGLDSALLGPLCAQAFSAVAAVLSVPLAVAFMAAVIGAMLQVGLHVSLAPLSPDFNRLNPVEGLKKIFSMRGLFDLGKNLTKMGAVVALLMLAGPSLFRGVLVAVQADAQGMMHILIVQVTRVLGMICALFAVFAVADLAFSRFDFLKRMRMTKQEVKDEHKQRDGDPKIKRRLRELRLEWLQKSRTMAQVPQADVLITNPTHIAVALVYRRTDMGAPRLLAKGQGKRALRMKELARRHNVMIVENRPLARSLYASVEERAEVPEGYFGDVARILAWVYAARKQA